MLILWHSQHYSVESHLCVVSCLLFICEIIVPNSVQSSIQCYQNSFSFRILDSFNKEEKDMFPGDLLLLLIKMFLKFEWIFIPFPKRWHYFFRYFFQYFLQWVNGTVNKNLIFVFFQSDFNFYMSIQDVGNHGSLQLPIFHSS